jgi:hypothetical protein
LATTIGHYDGSWMNCLKAIKDGLEEADITVLPRKAEAIVV